MCGAGGIMREHSFNGRREEERKAGGAGRGGGGAVGWQVQCCWACWLWGPVRLRRQALKSREKRHGVDSCATVARLERGGSTCQPLHLSFAYPSTLC
eukprot:355364-Chlamydomonas_euryale.AAC.2